MRYRVWWVLAILLTVGLVGGCTSAPVPASEVQSAPAEANTPAPQGAAAPAATLVVPADQGVYNGIPVGFTPEGYPYRGDPDAPLTVQEFSDFLCPFCGRHVAQTEPGLLEQYVKAGQVRFIFRDYPIVSLHPNAPRGHQAARCIAEQGAAFFWAMHDRLFQEQAQWQSLPDPTEYLAGVAQAAGADMTAYEACMTSGRTVAAVDQGVAEAQTLGLTGTPSFRFNRTGNEAAYTLVGAQPLDVFTQWISAMAAGGEPPVEPTPAPPELPFWAKPEGLAPDPERPGFTMAGDPYKGNPDAVMTVVEFSDFQCPSCQKHALEVQPEVDRTFVDTGEIRWVFKNLPLQEHPQAAAAATAAECAGEQGKFWEMHDLLFEQMEQWAIDDPDPVLVQLADKLALDSAAFATCLSSRTALERVLADVYAAQRVTNSTPTFIMLFGGQARGSRGVKSSEEFIQTLQAQLEAAKAEEVPTP